MTCKHCGKKNPDDATVCKYCGKELTAEPKAKPGKTQKTSMESLRQIILILLAAVAVALILALVGLLKGCSADKAANKAAEAAKAAETTAAAAQASADQSADVLQKALERIRELEDQSTAKPVVPDTAPEPTANARQYPATDPIRTLTAALDGAGKVTTLTYTDDNGAAVALEIGTAGIPTSYILNNVDDLVAYQSDIDLCAACEAVLPDGYTGEIGYNWESLTGETWEPRPGKTESRLTVSPGYWFSTRAQYRCEIVLTVKDGTGATVDEVSVYTKAVTYTDWEAYAEAHADEHDVFLQWSDMMKTYQ